MKSKFLLRAALLCVVLGVCVTTQLHAFQHIDCIYQAEFWCSHHTTESGYVSCWDRTYFMCELRQY